MGVLSEKICLRASIGKQELNSVPVHIIMTRMPNITTCKSDDLLIDVAEKLIEKQIDSIPIVKEKEEGLEVIGRVTKSNITKAFVTLFKKD